MWFISLVFEQDRLLTYNISIFSRQLKVRIRFTNLNKGNFENDYNVAQFISHPKFDKVLFIYCVSTFSGFLDPPPHYLINIFTGGSCWNRHHYGQICDWAKFHNRHSSKSIWVIKLSFCQNDPPILAKYQSGHSCTFWTMLIMIFLVQSQIWCIALYTSHRKVYLNEFVQNLLCCNIDIIIFDLYGYGGS